ncbi:hypothetical protein [Bradyrhizobium liaoningense]|uniref:hypothetical protein n=1 Tax=Bradyrhizobium liaoningense TaxID=43992 RepID=UPI0004B2D5EE|nr:hypothetical protein [Bradyrhizobium liaoningense]
MNALRNLSLVIGVTFAEVISCAAQEVPNYCQVSPNRFDAAEWPSKHAWNLFVQLNHPAIDKRKRRGVADCTKAIGTPGTTAIWETWRNAATEVFLPVEPPEWDDNSLPDERPGIVPSPGAATMSALPSSADPDNASGMVSFHALRGLAGISPAFSPGDGVFDNRGGFGETRLNKITYNFVRDECLYNRQATERYAQAIVDRKKGPINLPADSIEVKAAWVDFEKEGTPAIRRGTFYTATYKGRQYGLATLHIITKDIPNWFWASFHHVDTKKNEWEIPDTFGRPTILKGTVWENYALGGAQTDFVTSTGERTLLSDHYVEFGFQKSSCITCHSTASIATTSIKLGVGMPLGQVRAVCLVDVNESHPFAKPNTCKRWAGEHLYKVLDGKVVLIEERGAPLRQWFLKDGNQVYFQTDFLFSIPFRSGQVEEQGAVPDRCKW